MIKLHIFGRFGDLPDLSPYCLKVDTYMTMAGVEFERVCGIENLKKAPKGKLPFIEDGGEIVADSSFIIAHLQARHGDPLNEHLSAEQKAISHAFCKMLDENLYWCLVWARWAGEEIWPQLKQNLFGSLPPLLRDLVAAKVRKGVLNTLHGQGLGRHSAAEIKTIMMKDLQALSDFLGDKSYFFGSRPSVLDAVAYGFLAQFLLAPLQSSVTQVAKGYPNLVSFCRRIQSTYYQDQTP